MVGQYLREFLVSHRSLHRAIADARAAPAARGLLELTNQRFTGEDIEVESDGGDVLSGDAGQLLGIEGLGGAT